MATSPSLSPLRSGVGRECEAEIGLPVFSEAGIVLICPLVFIISRASPPPFPPRPSPPKPYTLTLQVHDDTLVIFTDSDDVLLMPGCTPDMLRDKFSRRHSKAPILFSAERDNW